jgi:hypothetical protein
VARFEVIDPHGGPAPPGPWEAQAAPAASFGTGEAAAPIWRVSLPAEPATASVELLVAERDLATQEAAVAAAPERLQALRRRGGATSFGAASNPEARLQALLQSAGLEGGISFGGGGKQTELAAAEERFRAFVQQVEDAVANYALVETRLGQRLLARSSVSWTGDTRSLFGVGLAADQHGLHRRSLALAMASRAALLRTFAVVMRGAALVALMASSPAGVVYALPAAWRFVDDLLRESRRA